MKKRNMPKISAVILAVLICVFAGILIGKLKENYDPEIFSENYISVDEVKQELIFTVYSQEEWDEWFEGGKKDYLTGAVLDELLKRLGVSEQIDFSEKRKNAAVSRTEWNQVYAQILAFLDMEQSVKKETLLVLNRMEMEDQTVLVTNQGDFYTKLQNTYFTDWMSYDVFYLQVPSMKKSYRRDGYPVNREYVIWYFGMERLLQSKQNRISYRDRCYPMMILRSRLKIMEESTTMGSFRFTRPMEMCLKNPYRMSFWAI